jgi:hypothetical protein
MKTFILLLACVVAAAGEAAWLAAYAQPGDRALPTGAAAFAAPEIARLAPDRLGISQWTRTAGPDETVAVAGWGFTDGTRFLVAAGTGAPLEATVQARTEFTALVTLPKGLPAPAMYLLWPQDATGAGEPVAINRPEVWYTIPRKAAPGGPLTVYGRNLANADPGTATVRLHPKAGGKAVTLSATGNPYAVELNLPADLPAGEYEVWLHRNAGGSLGWGALHAGTGSVVATKHLTIAPAHVYDGPTFDTRTFGAKGDGKADDTEAVLAALAKANATKNSTILFPTGTYLMSQEIGPVSGPEKSGMRILGEGMAKTFIKGNPANLPKRLMFIEGADVELRGLTLDINYLGESGKLYRDTKRPVHDPAHYEREQVKKDARDAEKAKEKGAENERERKLKAWKADKANKGKPVPPELEAPAKAEKPPAKEKAAAPNSLLEKKGWEGGLRIIDCVLDAERWKILLHQGLVDAVIENCDIVSNECLLGAPQYTRIDRCNFYARADAGVMMYLFGGWCNAITRCTGQDYLADTYDVSGGRFFTVSAYGNRPEFTYLAHNRTTDLTVQPWHFNQNQGEQIMWEFMDPVSEQQPTAVGDGTLTFAQPVKDKDNKVAWYTTAVVTAGKGLGQYVQVKAYDEKTGVITLAEPFRVNPTTASTVLICRVMTRAVVYKNQLDAKPRAWQREEHIASSGVQPFGGSIDLTVDGNTFSEIRCGIHVSGNPSFFHLYQGNTFATGRWGLGVPAGGAALGLVARRNTIRDMAESAVQVGGRYGKDALTAKLVLEHTTVEGAPVAVQLGNPRNSAGDGLAILLYKNIFRLGKAAKTGSSAMRAAVAAMFLERGNTIEGYAAPYAPFPDPPPKK